MNQIRKYEINSYIERGVELPLDAEVVHFEALDLDVFYIWCKFNPLEDPQKETRTEWRYFEVYDCESIFEGSYIASAARKSPSGYGVVHLVECDGGH